MKGVDPKIMMRIWRALVLLERSSDFELAGRAKIAHGNITNWQSPVPPKIVRLSTLKQIEDNLGYDIDVRENGEYSITKREMGNHNIPSQSLYKDSHLSETEGGLTKDDVKLLDSLSVKLSEIAKQIEELKNKRK